MFPRTEVFYAFGKGPSGGDTREGANPREAWLRGAMTFPAQDFSSRAFFFIQKRGDPVSKIRKKGATAISAHCGDAETLWMGLSVPVISRQQLTSHGIKSTENDKESRHFSVAPMSRIDFDLPRADSSVYRS